MSFTDEKQVREENIKAVTAKLEEAFADNEEPAVLIPIGYAADERNEKIRKAIEEIYK